MGMECLDRTDEYILLLEKFRHLLDSVSMTKFSSRDAYFAYRKGVSDCITIIETQYDELGYIS